MGTISVKNEKYLWAFVALVGLYVGLYFALPTDPETLQRYNLSQTSVRLLGLTVVIPLLGVFFATLYGFLKFKDYASSIADTKEGRGFQYLSNGLMVLAFSLPTASIVSSVLNYIALSQPDLLPTATILKNYIALIFPLVTFILLARGAESLVRSVRGNQQKRHYNGLLLIVLSCLFTWLITTRPHSNGAEVTYYLPNWLVITTLAIPYLYTWSQGIMTISNLRLYRASVGGKVYKRALGYLAQGVTGIVLLSIIGQAITTLSARLDRLSLTPVLIIVYILIILYALGYGLVARGAKQLKKIEEA